MPPKTSEPQRQEVIRLRKQEPPATYREIERATGLTQPTIAKILSEAGLTAPKTKSPASPSAPTPTTTRSSSDSQPGAAAIAALTPEAKSMPKPKAPKTPPPAEDDVYECNTDAGGCGAQFTEEPGVDPTECPGCGAEF